MGGERVKLSPKSGGGFEGPVPFPFPITMTPEQFKDMMFGDERFDKDKELLSVILDYPRVFLEYVNSNISDKNEKPLDFEGLYAAISNYKYIDFEIISKLLGRSDLLDPYLYETVIDMMTDPRAFLTEEEKKKPGHRTRFVEKLHEQMNDYLKHRSVDTFCGEVPVGVPFAQEFLGLRNEVATLHKVLQKGENPLYYNTESSKDLLASQYCDLDMLLNYQWVLEDELVGQYAGAGSVAALWEKKIGTRSKKGDEVRLKKIADNAVEFTRHGSPKEPRNLEQLMDVSDKQLQAVSKFTRGSKRFRDLEYGTFGDVIEADYFISIMAKELIGPGEKVFGKTKKEFTPTARIQLINMILRDHDSHITLIPALNDREVSFGAYQTLEKTHKALATEFAGHMDLPAFEDCLCFEDQTRVAVLLTYQNIRGIEQALFREGSSAVKKNRSKMIEGLPLEDKKDFYYYLAAVAHNRGAGFVRAKIRQFGGEIFKSEKGKSAYEIFKEKLFASLGSGANKYADDVVKFDPGKHAND